MRSQPPDGFKLVRDWLGKNAHTTRELSSGAMKIPKGTFVHVTQVSPAGMTIQQPPCRCCGVSIYMRRIHSSDLQVSSIEPK